jgi:hypothetical protein
MKTTLVALLALIMAGPPVPAQDLSADVLLLARVRRQVADNLRRLSNVSCLETVFRDEQGARGKLRLLDTVRLEVLTDGKKEFYASPGDRKFSEDGPGAWIGSGTIGDGFFGLYLASVFLSGNVSYAWKGNETVGGRSLARWDFRIPLLSSGQVFVLQEGTGSVSLHGSFGADPETADVVSVDIAAGDFPPSLPLSSARWTINYAITSIAGQRLLLPQDADFRMVRLSGRTTHNRFVFTQCHSYTAETTLSFAEPETGDAPTRFAASDVDDTLRALPPGLEIPVRLRTHISDEATVGSLIEGVVPRTVLSKGSIVIPAGSPVRGRVRRLEREIDPSPFAVMAIEWTEVSIENIRYRFDAELSRIDPAAGVQQSLSFSRIDTSTASTNTLAMASRGIVKRSETIHYSEIPGVATFFVIGAKLNLQNLQTVWKSR